jgi:hypothetical protein
MAETKNITKHKKPSLIAAGLMSVLRFYRFTISCLLGHCCRFEPTCSTYALEAITIHGCFNGCRLAVWRVLRCHPWHPGGIDPVPLAPNQKCER